jgi:hypothetical protein
VGFFKQGFQIMDIERPVDFEAIKGLPVAGITKVTPVFVNHAGPLPLGKAFQSSGGSFLIFVSGSLYATRTQLMQLGIFLDGEQVQTCQQWANPTGTHMSLLPVLFTTGRQPAGNHVIELRLLSGNTVSDQNDYYNATIVELT